MRKSWMWLGNSGFRYIFSIKHLNWLLFEQGYYNESYYQDADPELAEAEEPGNSAMFDDEGVWNQKPFY